MVTISALAVCIIMFIVIMLECTFERLILLLISFGLFCFGCFVNIEYKETYEHKYSVKLENIKDNTFISGRIHMIFGSGEGDIKEEFKYSMYYRTKNGAKMVTLPVGKCNIIYSERKELETVFIKNKRTDWWKEMFITDVEEFYYNIYIPRNSIDNDFTLDAQ